MWGTSWNNINAGLMMKIKWLKYIWQKFHCKYLLQLLKHMTVLKPVFHEKLTEIKCEFRESNIFSQYFKGRKRKKEICSENDQYVYMWGIVQRYK